MTQLQALAKKYGFKNVTNPESHNGAQESYLRKFRHWCFEFGVDKDGKNYLLIYNDKPRFIKKYPRRLRVFETILNREGFYR